MDNPVMNYVGWFDDPRQTVPAHDPGAAAGCPICGGFGLTNDNCRTVSLLAEGDSRSYFFRMHRACSEDRKAVEEVEHAIIDLLDRPPNHTGD